MALVRWGDRDRFGSDDWRVQSCGALGQGSFLSPFSIVIVFSFYFLSYFYVGLPTQDCIVVSISPPDPHRGPIGDMRCVIPIRLVTDPAWDEGAMSSDVVILQRTPTPSEEEHGSALATSAGVAGAEEEAPEYTRDSYATLVNAL
jgi:hypothetical protein